MEFAPPEDPWSFAKRLTINRLNSMRWWTEVVSRPDSVRYLHNNLIDRLRRLAKQAMDRRATGNALRITELGDLVEALDPSQPQAFLAIYEHVGAKPQVL